MTPLRASEIIEEIKKIYVARLKDMMPEPGEDELDIIYANGNAILDILKSEELLSSDRNRLTSETKMRQIYHEVDKFLKESE